MLSGSSAVAFARPGGEAADASRRAKPVDLAHLSRQTMGDREVERQVLTLFAQQAASVRDRLPVAGRQERLQLAHQLKGSARGIGAFPIADCAAEIELRPDDAALVGRLATLVGEVRDFIAAISR